MNLVNLFCFLSIYSISTTKHNISSTELLVSQNKHTEIIILGPQVPARFGHNVHTSNKSLKLQITINTVNA